MRGKCGVRLIGCERVMVLIQMLGFIGVLDQLTKAVCLRMDIC